MTIGERIAARRTALGLTQQALAVKVGKNVTTISRYECNELEPRSEALGEIAGALACSTDHLILGAPIDAPSETAA
jgi:transcriptional regulator with XRE-family HTH domain